MIDKCNAWLSCCRTALLQWLSIKIEIISPKTYSFLSSTQHTQHTQHIMFKKPLANLKSFSPLRSSDRRRFQNEAYDAYPSVKEICTASTEEGASSTTHLMPDDLRSAKFISHTGTAGVVYKSEKQALWISLENLPPIPTGKNCQSHVDMSCCVLTLAQ